MKLNEIKKVAIIGSGTMGAGMALSFARPGMSVNLYDIEPSQLNVAMERIRDSLKNLIREEIVSSQAAMEIRKRVHLTTDLKTALDGVSFVLEAVPEILDLKLEVFKKIEPLCSSKTIIASNTSGLSISKISSVCRHPERVGGMHWVNPPEFVPLVEIIRGEKTSDETLKLIFNLAEKMGKKPVMIQREAPGFGLNRIQFAILREAFNMIQLGIVSPEDLDRIVKYGLGFRYPWVGPLETADLGGLDVFHNIACYLFSDLSSEKAPPAALTKLIENNKLGVKTGHGFYEYKADAVDKMLSNRDIYFIRQWKLIQEVKEE